MSLYHIITLIKIVVGVVIIFFTSTAVDPYQDPWIWLGFGFWWVFMLIRWISFYIFWWWKTLFANDISTKKNKEQLAIDSYKLSLLFWLYIIVNLWIMFQWYWTRFLWILLFIGFVVIQIFISIKPEKGNELKREF